MIDAIIAVILTHLATITREQLWEEVRLVGGVEKEITKLESEFKSIKAALVDAEKRRVKDESWKVWLGNLTAVCYEIEKVLCECIIAMQKGQIEGQRTQSSSLFKKVCCFFIFPCHDFRRIWVRRDVARKIKKLNEILENIAIEKQRYTLNQLLTRQKTTSFINVSEVRGRDQDKKTIMSKMFPNNKQDKGLNILSIVGIHGIGKTTLAQLVYNSDDVTQHFDMRIWACAADPNFDEIQIAKAILEGITRNGDDSNLFQLETITEKIRDHVKGKKFLLVLDDVYIDDFRELEHVFNTLTTGAAGSTILVTTTKESAAIAMRPSYQLPLGELSLDDSWYLFKDTAFLEQNEAQWGRLEMIWTSEIARKCKGSPLRIKNFAIKLRSKELDEWQDVLNREF